MIKGFLKDKYYYKTMLAIAIPVSIQSLFQASLSMIDQFMIGQLGEEAIAAVGLGSRFPFILLITLGAIASVTSIFAAQFWGKKDTPNIGRTLGGTFIFGAFITTIFTLISLMFSQQVLNLYTKDTKIVELGSVYLRIIAVGYIPMLFISIYSSVLRSTEHVKTPMYAGLFAVGLNTLLNYLFIFGKFGLPHMGLYGAAYATTITRFVECVLILIITYVNKYPAAFKINEMFDISLVFMKKIFIVASPLLISEFMWALGETMYSIVYGRMGTIEVAAMTLTYPIQGLSIGLFSGVSSAAGIMIGNKLGIWDNEVAFKYSKKFIKLGIVGSSIFGVLLIICSNLYVSVFNVSSDVKDYTIKILVMFSIVLWIKVSNMIIGGGILRSGGKTKYTLYLDIVGTWGIGVPIGFISAFVLKLPIQWVYLIISGEELVRLIIGLKLVYSKKWMKNITETKSKIDIVESI
ncbi:MATE family efflux transporter [Clostridium ganghwense]|uniref:Probable multidrug resistance protein NorM n=1 Tax=Clostridium ganghwense TaxID=312089 RepID=A0ABT4CVC1_9CLOT|nr:MATE family efflux transporter [Clostridium ganghwense]MCY6371894.1 MATE family efflux transporter [Clostridium ganghwense]